MYGIVLMMSVSGGADVPANELFEPPAKLTQTAYRHRRGGGCCGGGYGGCYGGGCYGGGYGGCCGGGYGGGYAYGGYPTVYSGYAYGGMPYGSYSGYYPGAGYGYGSYSPYYQGVPYGYDRGYNQMPYPSTGEDRDRDRPRDERLNPPRENRNPSDRDRGTNPIPERGTNPDRDRGTNPDRKPADQDRSRPEGDKPQAAAPRIGDMAPVYLVVKLPAEAKLVIGETQTRSTSDSRTFISPPVPTGKDFHYTLRAEINRDGKIMKTEKEVTVRGGEETVVELEPSAFVAANK
jgi:uncharacterized protein (TIGR03000 family)